MRDKFLSSSFLVLFFAQLNQACNFPHTNSSSPANTTIIKNIDTLAYRVYPMQNATYGFDILLNGKIYIHQPIVPCKEGLNGFATQESAQSVAELMTERLKNGDYRYLIKEDEIDSLEGNLKRSLDHIQPNEINGENINQVALFLADDDKVSQSDILASLPEPPIKNSWEPIGTVPFGNRTGCLAFTIGKIIFIGGGQFRDETHDDFWSYNTVTNSWTCMPVIPGGLRLGGIAFSINNKGYIGLGGARGENARSFKNDFYEYDPVKNIWLNKAKFPGAPRIDACSFVLNNKGYVGTGYDENYFNDFYEYEPLKDEWKRIADFLGGPVSASAGVSTGKHGYVIAGDRVPENKRFIYEYIPEENKWIKRTDFPGHARYFLTAFPIDTALLIAGAGGADGGDIHFRDFFLYNSTTDMWTRSADYLASKDGNSRPCGGGVNGKVYAGTGYDGRYLNKWNVYEYYFSVRTDTGLYDEGVCYPLKYNGTWELFQECTDDCYAGAAIKTANDLGNFCYTSYLSQNVRQLVLRSNNQAEKKFIILPRKFHLSSEKPAEDSVGVRFFFTKSEIENFARYFEKTTGKKFDVSMLKILQNENGNNLLLNNNVEDANTYHVISTQFFGYGYNQQTYVSSINVSQLNGNFYLALQLN